MIVTRTKITDYITEEVKRQGHNTNMPTDGLCRVAWMIEAWVAASTHTEETFDLNFIIELGRMIEPVKNKYGLRTVGVTVGDRTCPPACTVRPMLEELLEDQVTLEPLLFYRQFEMIHPFVDGNGRTGKVLLNALNRTLHNPIFPPSDFWGVECGNP